MSAEPWKWAISRKSNPYVVIRGKHNATITVFMKRHPSAFQPLGWTYCIAHDRENITFAEHCYKSRQGAQGAAREEWDKFTGAP